jgi:molybdate transport system ATP-binding protein
MGLFVEIKKKLPGFTLDVRLETASDSLGLLGASGAGKSMTLRCIAGLETPDEGRIVLNGRVLFDSCKGIDISCRNRRIGFLFQNYALFPNMTVEENIGFALEGIDKKQKNSIVQKMIGMFKLEGLENRRPGHLSGGQQQRVALARALAIDPEVLLLDEPFSALDDHLRELMVKQLMDTLSNYRGDVLFVTHNIEEAYRMCNKLLILKDGHVEAQGDREKLFQEPPTMSAARLTGCKNFSSAKYLLHHRLEAVDWGIELKTKALLTEELKQVGIRAHNIRLASEVDSDNVFKCWLLFASETPFRVTLFLSLGKEPSGPDDCQLQWEVSKEMWHELQMLQQPWNIYLNPDSIMVFDR